MTKVEDKYDDVIAALKERGIRTIQHADSKGTFGVTVRKGNASIVVTFGTGAWRFAGTRSVNFEGQQFASRSASAATIADRAVSKLDDIIRYKAKCRASRRTGYTVAPTMPRRAGSKPYVGTYAKYLKKNA